MDKERKNFDRENAIVIDNPIDDSFDGIVEELMVYNANGKSCIIKHNNVELFSGDIATPDDAYKIAFGMTKEEYEKEVDEVMEKGKKRREEMMARGEEARHEVEENSNAQESVKKEKHFDRENAIVIDNPMSDSFDGIVAELMLYNSNGKSCIIKHNNIELFSGDIATPDDAYKIAFRMTKDEFEQGLDETRAKVKKNSQRLNELRVENKKLENIRDEKRAVNELLGSKSKNSQERDEYSK